MEDTRRDPERAITTGKRPYVRPFLTEYGSVAKLTQAASGFKKDKLGGAF